MRWDNEMDDDDGGGDSVWQVQCFCMANSVQMDLRMERKVTGPGGGNRTEPVPFQWTCGTEVWQYVEIIVQNIMYVLLVGRSGNWTNDTTLICDYRSG